jgi:hypothetical protein
MTITFGSFSFGSHIHGTPNVSPWDYSDTVQTFHGLRGETHLIGDSHGRDIVIPFELTGLSSLTNLLAAVEAMASEIGESGTLIIDLGGGDAPGYTPCIFNGFTPSEDPWRDGSGVNGWQQRGTLKFRHIAS